MDKQGPAEGSERAERAIAGIEYGLLSDNIPFVFQLVKKKSYYSL